MKLFGLLGNISRDIIVPLACSAAIIVSSTLLYLDFTRKIVYTGSEQIATITFKKKVAERKYSGVVIWEELAQDSPIYNYDSVRTAENSLSVIKFRDKSVIEIGENSLILLEWSEEGARIDFTWGTVSAKNRESTGRKMKIVSGGAEVSVGKGDVQLAKTDAKQIQVNVSFGNALVETDAGEAMVTEEKSAVITAEKTVVRENTLLLKYPAPGSSFVAFAGKQEILFKWESKAGKEELLLEVSDNNSFTDIITSKKRKGTEGTVPLPAGEYFWRVRRPAADKEISESRRFIVHNDSESKPILPAEGTQYTMVQEKPLIQFAWSAAGLASSYELLIAADPKMEKIILSVPGSGTNISIDKLDIGKYYWSVNNIYGFGEVRSLRNRFTGSFSIIKKRAVPPPEIVSPKENLTLSAAKLAKEGIFCNWNMDNEISKYMIEVSGSREFKDIVLKAETNSNYYKLTGSLDPGSYYIRVTGILGDGKKTGSSQARSFEIEAVREKTLFLEYPVLEASFITFSEKQEIPFKWKSKSDKEELLLEVSGDNSFADILTSRKIKGTQGKLSLPAGEYFWRVRRPAADKEISESRKFLIHNDAVSKMILPAEDAQYTMFQEKPLIQFAWTASKFASSYELQIAGDPKMEKIILTIPGSETNISIDKLDIGRYYWSVNNIYGSGEVKSLRKRFTGSFSIIKKRAVPPPEIMSPNDNFTVNARIFSKEGVFCNWGKDDEISQYLIEVSGSNEFKDIVLKAETNNNYYKLTGSLDPGSYYIRVTGILGDGKKTSSSQARSFKIEASKEKTLVLESPETNSSFIASAGQQEIIFKWKSEFEDEEFLLEVSSDNSFEKIITSQKTKGAEGKASMPPGEYFWRVSSTGVYKEITEARRFIIEKREVQIQPPEITSPKNNAVISEKAFSGKGIYCSWIGDDKISKYFLEVSGGRDFSDTVLKEETKYNFFTLKGALKPGRYYIRVSGILEDGKKTGYSGIRSFSVQAEKAKAITEVSPADGAAIDLADAVYFEWNDPNQGNKYLFQIAGDKAFRKLIHSEYTEKTSFILNKNLAGAFFWRVSLVDDNKKVLAASRIFSANMTLSLAGPELIEPKNHVIIDMTDKSALSFSWKEVKNATHYKVRVFQFSSRVNRKIFEIKTDKTDIDFTKMEILDKGNFYWEVQALAYSDDILLKKGRAVKSYFSIKLDEPQEAPEIITSGPLYIK